VSKRIASLVVAILAAFAAPASAQVWPTRPVTMVVPFAAGGAFDILGRVLAQRMAEILGAPVIVENVAGAGGVVAAVRVARGAADGSQFILGDSSFAHNQSLYKNPPFNPVTDFAPVALIAEQPTVLVVRKEMPVNTLAEFIAFAKANQTKMQYGSAGTGSPNQLACLLLNARIGIDVTHIPYRGGGPLLQDIIGGRLDYACPIAATAITTINSGQTRGIAILTRNRSPALPDLASADEQGLTGFEAGAWNALFAPKATPEAIVSRLHDAAALALDTPMVAARIAELGAIAATPERRSADYLKQFLAQEIDKWAVPIKAAHVSLD
jgi:tripartite-type tricarboxylate transporter receptor subunit TctC